LRGKDIGEEQRIVITDESTGASQLLRGTCPGCPQIYAYNYKNLELADRHIISMGQKLYCNTPKYAQEGRKELMS